MSDKKKRDYLHLSPGADRKFEAIIVLEGTPKSDVRRRAVSLLIEAYEKKNGDIDVLLSKHNKDDDNNGYIDDNLGWNFLKHSNDMLPNWGHGTNVAGIIWALTNNNFGIAGVSNDSKLMSLIACDETGCGQNDIVEAINYAVDNGADIINMSIAGKWFSYNAEVTRAVENARNNNVIVVISAWNWDGWMSSKWINTSENKISPVCNENKNSDIIGVSALSLFSDLTVTGSKTAWTNYGACSDINAYGERITSISKDGNYDILDGTSYSAPIISGVIALWYNKFWKIDSSVVYDALQKSKNTWHGVDAYLYLQELEKNINALQKNEAQEQEQVVTQETVADNTALYLKLEDLESDMPGILDILLPALKAIEGKQAYKKHAERISLIIEYIETRSHKY